MLQDQTFVFVGTAESIANAKLLLDYNLAHLKVNNSLRVHKTNALSFVLYVLQKSIYGTVDCSQKPGFDSR